MRVVLKYLGYLLLISIGFRFLPIAFAIAYGESVVYFVATIFISLVIGIGCLILSGLMEAANWELGGKSIDLTHALVLTALSFVVLSMISAVSYLPVMNNNYLNAVFESISGFTTTGLSVLNSVNDIPKSLLIWRAETQWMGGVGIIMVFLFILSRLNGHSYDSKQEGKATKTSHSLYLSQGYKEKLSSNLRNSSRNVLVIYLSFTVIGIILFMLAGLPPIEAISLSFTSLSTGGFSVNDEFYSNGIILSIISLLMILGSISFVIHNRLMQKKFKEAFESVELRIFLCIAIISIGLGLISLNDVKLVAFQILSALTTTGFSVMDNGTLPSLLGFVLLGCMIIGGGLASTSGGIKIFRFYAMLKSVPWMIRRLISPENAIIPLKIDDTVLEERDMIIIQVFGFSYIFFLMLGALVFLILGFGMYDSLFNVASALGTVGLQSISMEGVPWIGKIVLMFEMLLGRLEIFPVLVMIYKFFGE